MRGLEGQHYGVLCLVLRGEITACVHVYVYELICFFVLFYFFLLYFKVVLARTRLVAA